MSDLTACPTCQATLRIPPGAAAIRCPNCKTVLNIPASPTAPAPPPLPFGRAGGAAGASSGKLPAVKLPAAKLPTAKLPAAKPAEPPVPTASAAPAAPPTTRKAQTAVRIVSAPEDADPERRRLMQKELKKLEREEERKEEEYEELKEACRYGRKAITFAQWAIRVYAFGALLIVAGALGSNLGVEGFAGVAAWTAMKCGGWTVLFSLIAFVYALLGPREGRHLGVMGIGVVVLHAGVAIALFVGGYVAFVRSPPPEDKWVWTDSLNSLKVFGMVTNLPLLAEHPARGLKSYPISVLGLVGAALEFTRLVLICLLAQNYASAGRARELAHASMESVSRIFWVVLLSAMFRVSFAFMFDSSPPGELWAGIGHGVHAGLTVVTLLGIGYFLFKESQILEDTAEVVDARRLSLEGEFHE